MTTEFDTLTHATADERTGIAWWNSLGKAARLYWLRQAGSAVLADAWSEYKRTQSRIDWCRNDFPPSAARPTKINMRQARCGCAAGLSIGVGCRPPNMQRCLSSGRHPKPYTLAEITTTAPLICRLNLEAPEPSVLPGGSLCHRAQQAIASDRRNGGRSKTTACSDRSRTCLAPPVSRE